MISIEQIRPELTWRLRREALYPNEPLHAMEMEEDNHGLHFGAFMDNALVGVVSLFQKGNDWQFRKFAVSHMVQRQGIGKQMLNYITNFVERENGIRIWCNARLSATGFYTRFGFAEAGEVFHKKGVDYIIMEKELLLK
jgi:predicted GNAT family N-acyltransferase